MSRTEPTELMRQLMTGQMSRRSFITRAAALGFSASAIATFLAACGGGAATTAPTAATGGGAAPTAATGGAAATMAPTKAATTAAAGGAATPASSGTMAAGSPTTAGSPPASPASGGGGGLGVMTDKPLGAGGGLGPGPTKRGGGGPVKLLWWQAPTILNPHLASGTKDFDASRVTYEPLAAFGPDDKLVPFLAAEIPTAQKGLAPDGKSVTWKLKSGLKWSDGQPFSAKDVAFTFKFISDKATAATTSGNYKDIESVDAVDDTTVKITFKAATPGWFTVFTGPTGMILPEHIFKDGIGANAKNFPGNLKPVGTGPYKVDSFKPGDTVSYSINTNWRDANGPFFDTVELKGGGDATSAARAVMQTGDYQVAWNLQVEPQILKQMESGGKGRIELTPNWGIERILVNFSDPNKEVNGQRSEKNTPHPFQSDKNVRLAYNLLTDRKTISDTLYGATGQPTANILTNPKAYNSPNTKWEFSIDKANGILDKAGWVKSGQYRAKGGVNMAVVFQTSVNSVRQKHQQIVKDAFEKAGIKMEIKSVDGGVFFSSDAGNPDTYKHFYTDLEMYTSSNDSPDPWSYFQGWISSEIPQKDNSWNLSNVTRWSDKAYDDLVAAAKTELDGAKRTQQFIKMNDMLIGEVVVIPQVDRLGPQAFAAKLKNPQLTAWDSTIWNIANWTMG